MEEQFVKKFEQLVEGDDDPALLERVKSYLSTMERDERNFVRGPNQLKPIININQKNLLEKVKDLDLFKMLIKLFLNPIQLHYIFEKLYAAPNQGKKIRILEDFIKTVFNRNPPNHIDYIGSDLSTLRLEALNFLSTTGKDTCTVYIDNYDFLTEVLKHGFIPNLKLYDMGSRGDKIGHVLEHPTVPVEALRYMYSYGITNDFYVFDMVTEKEALRLYELYPETNAVLKWLYPHLLYSTGRLITNMSMFRTPFSNVGKVAGNKLQSSFGTKYILEFEQDKSYELEGDYCIPVTRYASSVDAGLYHGKAYGKQSFCGTYYYNEPESKTFLMGNTILVAQTKYSAIKHILNNKKILPETTEKLELVMKTYMDYYHNKNWEEAKYRGDLLYTVSEIVDLGVYLEQRDNLPSPYEVAQIPLYAGKSLNLYSREDVFDQPLCLLCKEVDIELVVLTRMVGSKQIVTEVLDARSREDSLKNLIFT